ncbi:hypothetical protein NE237_030846 [Protea cynaroides]|uniref:Uncharacterized protein n=1 Tax=Protea cynaroides TaxID=273540 RepID=A0A9Q0GUW6_9MAGN|nr:hypothetical protein NE237_030846 [Protea cynaroides]
MVLVVRDGQVGWAASLNDQDWRAWVVMASPSVENPNYFILASSSSSSNRAWLGVVGRNLVLGWGLLNQSWGLEGIVEMKCSIGRRKRMGYVSGWDRRIW